MSQRRFLAAIFLLLLSPGAFAQQLKPGTQAGQLRYVVVDTGQDKCYDTSGEIAAPKPGQPFFGQDAQYAGPQPKYNDNRDGTITDLNTGLTWVQARGEKIPWDDAVAGASKCRVAGHNDWRMPTIKELYSLIDFRGGFHQSPEDSRPYLDTRYFGFVYGDEARGERAIDCQDWSSTEYIGTTMNGQSTVFGVNFADGRIKGYPKFRGPAVRHELHRLYVRYVRGNDGYGKNNFHDNSDGTITDQATNLMWAKADSGRGMNWQDALGFAQAMKLAGHSDWRLPNAKELQSIVDYTRSPAIDPVFKLTKLTDGDYPFYWTSTTHLDSPIERMGTAAVYIAFGRATGWMRFPPDRGEAKLMDVHGAGAQRSDPKAGDPGAFPQGRGPQGDVVRINNFVRCVRSVQQSPAH